MKALIAFVLIAAAAGVQAQPYTSDWAAFDAGHGQSQGGAVANRGVFNGWLRHTLQSANYKNQAAHPSMPAPTINPGIPSLYIRLVGNDVRVSWPVWASSYVLEESLTLAPLSWTSVPGPYDTDGAEWYVIEPQSGSGRFYRLMRP